MIYLWITSMCIASVLTADYRDLERMGVACSPRDTCKRTTTDFRDTNCECGRSCLSYNDCCVDGPPPTRSSPRRGSSNLACIPFLPYEGAYGISKCSNSWSGPEGVKSKCENHDDISDPLRSVPVTHAETQVTYRNTYCALCNGAQSSGLTLWNLKLTCSSLNDIRSDYTNITDQFIMENIVLVGNSWGVYHWNKEIGRTSFFPCDLSFVIPQSVKNSVRSCRPNIVSSCARNWNRQTVRKDCESYMAVIYIDGQGYRNAHCALCNHVSVENLNCAPPREGDITKPVGWEIIFNVSKPSNRCSSEQVYDTYVKKCRRLICPEEGTVARNGECVAN